MIIFEQTNRKNSMCILSSNVKNILENHSSDEGFESMYINEEIQSFSLLFSI
jgi:hypothetical protein